MIKIVLLGEIVRECPVCHRHMNSMVFRWRGKTYLLCEDCLFDRFGVGSVVDNKKFVGRGVEWCGDCESLSMELLSTSIKDSFVVKKFRCKFCGLKVTRSIRKWKKKLGVSE